MKIKIEMNIKIKIKIQIEAMTVDVNDCRGKSGILGLNFILFSCCNYIQTEFKQAGNKGYHLLIFYNVSGSQAGK